MSATAEKNGRTTRNPLAPTPTPFPAEAATAPMPATLAEALSKFQGMVPTFAKTKTAVVRPKSGGAGYTYSYADLGDILPIVGPLMAEVGLSWSSEPQCGDTPREVKREDGTTVFAQRFPDMMFLRFELLHVSGESKVGEVPLGVPVGCAPQDLGSAMTYMRRYAQSSQLGLATEADDDGQAAQGVSTVVPASGQMPKAQAGEPGPGGSDLSIGKQRMLRAKAKMAGLSSVAFGNVLKDALGQPPSDSTDEEAAGRWLDQNLPRFPWQQVDKAVALISQAGAESSQEPGS